VCSAASCSATFSGKRACQAAGCSRHPTFCRASGAVIFREDNMLRHRALLGLVALSFSLGGLQSAQSSDDKGWITRFNGKDLTGWKLRNEKYTVTKFVNDKGDVIPGAKEGKVE